MKFSLCRLRTHQWCFLLFNVLLFHALLFGGDFVEEYLLQASPGVYADGTVLEVREKARKLDLTTSRGNVSQAYTIANPDACLNSDLFLLSLAFSAPANRSQRAAVRTSWANQTRVQGFPVRTLFFLGSSPSATQQEALLREQGRHGDLVQCRAAAAASPVGRTERTVQALRWVVAFCPGARFVLLTRDSAFVNLPALGGYLLGLRRHPEDLYLGRVLHGESPDRDPASPGYLPPSLYPDRHLPDYCSGAAALLSQDVVRKVTVAAAESPGLRAAAVPPDVFVGACARKAGVTATHSARFSGERHVRYNACCYRYLFSSAGVGGPELGRVWEDLAREGGRCSLLTTYYGLVKCKALTYLDKLSFFGGQQGHADKLQPNG
ncbi:beta-1,3-galactosyltransferase 9 [Aplochiton taeniatus]